MWNFEIASLIKLGEIYFLIKIKLKYKVLRKVPFYFLLRWIKLFNSQVRSQEKDHKKIPIIIISFNQLYYLKQLVSFLLKSGYENIVIVDNKSTYKPLLDYFNIIEKQVTLYKLNDNYGHRVFWIRKDLFQKYTRGYYAVTDADIVPDFKCPQDFLLHFKRILDDNYKVNKVGFSLRIDDIPEHNQNRNRIIEWEKKFWNKKDENGNFCSDIDTTFALYRPSSFSFLKLPFFKAIRTKEPYMAVHGGWYINTSNLTREQKHFMKTASNSSSWRISSGGDLSSSFSTNYQDPK